MPQIEMVTYGDTAILSVGIFWTYFIGLFCVGVKYTEIISFPNFFKTTLLVSLGQLHASDF